MRNEPTVALAGFDDLGPRRELGDAGFRHIVDAGIAAGPVECLDMVLHTFPKLTTPTETFLETPPRAGKLSSAYDAEISRAHICRSRGTSRSLRDPGSRRDHSRSSLCRHGCQHPSSRRHSQTSTWWRELLCDRSRPPNAPRNPCRAEHRTRDIRAAKLDSNTVRSSWRHDVSRTAASRVSRMAPGAASDDAGKWRHHRGTDGAHDLHPVPQDRRSRLRLPGALRLTHSKRHRG